MEEMTRSWEDGILHHIKENVDGFIKTRMHEEIGLILECLDGTRPEYSNILKHKLNKNTMVVMPELFLLFLGVLANTAKEIIENKIGDPLFVFVSKKGYWFYRLLKYWIDIVDDDNNIIEDVKEMFQRYFNAETVRSDRYFTKALNFEELDHKTLVIVDDFAVSGGSLKRFQRYINDEIKKASLDCNMISLVFLKQTGLDVDALYCAEGYADEIAKLCVWETKEFQKCGLPYVIDLPLLQVSDRDLPTKVSDKAFYSGLIMPEKFESLIRPMEGRWHFVDGDYTIDDYKVQCGFFYYEGDVFTRKFKNLIQNLVMECRYNYCYDKQEVLVTLTPFAILRSVKHSEMYNRFQIAFQNSEYLKHMQNSYVNTPAGDNTNTALYRSMVFFFSVYIMKEFSTYMNRQGITIDLDWDQMQNHWSSDFRDVFKNVLTDDLWQIILRHLYAKDDATKYVPPKLEKQVEELNKIDYTQMFYSVFSFFTWDKEERQFWTIEEIEYALFTQYGDLVNSQEFDVMFTRALLELINKGVVRNTVHYNEEYQVIERGFRLGENYSVLLPFNQSAVFCAIYTFFEQCKEFAVQNHRAVYDVYSKNYPTMVCALINFIKNSELDEYVRFIKNNSSKMYNGGYLDGAETHKILDYFGRLKEREFEDCITNKKYIVTRLYEKTKDDSIDALVARQLSDVVMKMELK